MTTTQRFFTNEAGAELQVHENNLFIKQRGFCACFVFDTPEQAHRASLAILTGPGKVKPEGEEYLMSYLDHGSLEIARHIATLDARPAAEAEAAELEAEAEQLYAAYAKAKGWYVPWWTQSEETQQVFRGLAREARRLHTNKETRS